MRATATATRSGQWWAIEVNEIPGLFTQTKRLDQVATMVRDAATLLGHDVSEVHVIPQLPNDEAALVATAKERRAQLRVVEELAATSSRAAVKRLRSDGMTVRDIAALLNLSPQRVSVLAH